jgi:hypothetical protein
MKDVALIRDGWLQMRPYYTYNFPHQLLKHFEDSKYRCNIDRQNLPLA